MIVNWKAMSEELDNNFCEETKLIAYLTVKNLEFLLFNAKFVDENVSVFCFRFIESILKISEKLF
jgi:hypothetical protein